MVKPEPVGCLCSGDVLTYECTVIGEGDAGVTIWKGSAFDNHCEGSKMELQLLHSRYNATSGEVKFCEDRILEARSVKVENNSYTSQLNVTLTSNITGKIIECAYDNGHNTTLIGSLEITAGIKLMHDPQYSCIVLIIGLLQSILELCAIVSDISWMRVCPEPHLLLMWNVPECSISAAQYSITASNCGSCPTNTTHNNVTCTNAPTDGRMCTFVIQVYVSENITWSDQQIFNMTQRCSEDSKSLKLYNNL